MRLLASVAAVLYESHDESGQRNAVWPVAMVSRGLIDRARVTRYTHDGRDVPVHVLPDVVSGHLSTVGGHRGCEATHEVHPCSNGRSCGDVPNLNSVDKIPSPACPTTF